MVLANRLCDFFLAFSCLQKLYVVPPKFPVVVETFLTILTLEVFHPVVNDLLMLGEICKILFAKVTELFLRVLNCMDGLIVSI